MAGVSSKSIIQQDWIGQARQLAGEQREDRTELAEPSSAPMQGGDLPEGISEERLSLDSLTPQSRKHFVNFAVELWLDDDNDVRRTRVIHIQDHNETAWSGWDDQKLMNFIVKRAGLSQVFQTSGAPQTRVDLESTKSPQGKGSKDHSQSQEAARPGPELHIKEMIVTTREVPEPTHILASFQPFHIRLVLDISRIDSLPGPPLDYSAVICARDLSKGTRRVVGITQGQLVLIEQAKIEIEGNALSAGLYRLETVVTLSQLFGGSLRAKQMAFLDGGVFQVY